MNQDPTMKATDRNDDELMRDVIELGRSWAAYGLTVGRLAVIQSARSLDQGAKILDGTAELLNGLSKGFRNDAVREQDDDSETKPAAA